MQFVRELLGKRLGLSSSEISEVDDNKDLRAMGPEDEFWAQLWDTNVHLFKTCKSAWSRDRAKKRKEVTMWPALFH